MEYDHVIEALATNGSNHSLDVGSLPRRARCRQDFADAHVSHLFAELGAENSIAVAQQITGELGKGKCLPQLLSRPLRGRVGGNVEVQNAAPVMGQHSGTCSPVFCVECTEVHTTRSFNALLVGHYLAPLQSMAGLIIPDLLEDQSFVLAHWLH